MKKQLLATAGAIVLAATVVITGISAVFVNADGKIETAMQIPNSVYGSLLSETFDTYRANEGVDVMRYKSQMTPMVGVAGDIISAKLGKSSVDNVKETIKGMSFTNGGFAVLTASDGSVVYDPSNSVSMTAITAADKSDGYYATYSAKTGKVDTVATKAISDDYKVAVVVSYPVDQAEEAPSNVSVKQDATTLYTTANVNVRTKPNTDSTILGVLAKGSSVTVKEVSSGEWSIVEYDGHTAYMSTQYLSTEKPVQESVVEGVEKVKEEPPVETSVAETQQVAKAEVEQQMPAEYNGYVKPSGDVSLKLLDYANSLLGRVPSALLNAFTQDGWTIYVTSDDLNDKYYGGQYGELSGITVYDDKVIELEDNKGDINGALVHEFGHYLDRKCEYPSYSAEFETIYNEEKYTFVDSTSVGDGHEISDTQEFFASVFSEAMLNPEGCKATAPKAYEYVMQIANSVQ